MKTRIRLLTALLAVSLLTGCGASSKNAYDSAAPEMGYTEEAAPEEDFYKVSDEMADTGSTAAGISTSSEVGGTAQVNRKLIRTFDLQIQTKEFDDVMSGIQA